MRRIVWGCALLLACLPPAVAQRADAKPKRQAEPAKPKSQPDANKPAGDKPSGDKPAGEGDAAPGPGSGGGRGRGGAGGGRGGDSGKPERTLYDYELPGPDGKAIPMSEFKGKVILLVNLARNSSYNDQLPGLIKLSEQFKDKGLVVIGVPSNDFGAAEPGTDADIQKAYADAKVPFLIMSRSPLIGDDKLPLYEFLTKGESGGAGGGARGGGAPGGGGEGSSGGGGGASSSSTGDVHWNYTKFLIDRNGKTVARLDPDVTPDSAEMLATLDKVFEGSDDKPRGQRPGRGPQQPPKNNTTASNDNI